MDLLDQIAQNIHDQWSGWAQTVLPLLSPEMQADWTSKLVPYADCPQEAKNAYRAKAQAILDIVNAQQQP